MSRWRARWSIRVVSHHYWRKTPIIRFNAAELAVVALLCLTEGAGCQRPVAGQADPKTPSPVAAGMPSGDRVQGWQKDVDTLMEEIKRHHYIYRTQPLPQALIQRSEELKKSVSKFSDERMLIELQGLMSHLGDGHCYILPFGARALEVRCLPLQLYLFSDGLFVVGADNGYERWLGRRLVRLGPVTVSDAMTRIADYISRDNPMGLKWVGPLFLRFRGTLEVLGLETGASDVALAFDTENGTVAEEKIPFVPAPQFRGVPKLGALKLARKGVLPLYLTDVETPYWIRELPDEKALYFQFNQVMNAPRENLTTFAQRLERILNERSPHLLVVDVRHNNGGHAELGSPLVDVLKRFEGSNPKASLVVITGRNTFSAAQIFIAHVNHQTRAIFAGEPSSSKPNFVGEENEVILPWSGARGSISNRYHETIPGDQRIWIEPEVRVELSSADYFANRDPVLQEVLKRFGKSASETR
jgi:hypothetical protein